MKRSPKRCSRVKFYPGLGIVRAKPFRCAGDVRPVREVAAELRDFPWFWRAVAVEGWSGELDARFEDRHIADGSSLLAHCADNYLPALALELEGKLCRECAVDVAQEQRQLQVLAFIGVLSALGTASGRDERAEEEFELASDTGAGGRSVTRREMEKLRHSLRALKASVTSLGEFLRARPKYPDPLHLEFHRLKASLAGLEHQQEVEGAALLEPHAFIRPAMPPPLDRRCVRCGFGRADAELHPPEMQVQRAEVAARV